MNSQDFAVTKLDDTEFKNPFEKCYIRVKKPKDQITDADRDRSRSKERQRGRGRRRSGGFHFLEPRAECMC